MNRLLASTAAIALSVFWTGTANAGWFDSDTPSKTDAAALTGPAATKPQPPEQPGDDNPDMADLLKNLPANLDGEIRRAQLLRANGDFKNAGKVLSEVMIVAPDDPRIVGEFGKVMTQEGRSQDAVAFLKRAIELQPNDWTYYSALGVAYDQLDDHAHARAAYEHALTLKPGEASVLNNYAVSRMLAGDLPGAQRLLAKASVGSAEYPKIAGNVAMLDSMSGPKVSAAPMASVATSSAPVVGAPRPLAGVSRSSSGIVGVAVNAPNPSGSTVVMQKVPVDPMAGPVATAHPAKLAKATTHAKKPSSTAVAAQDATPAPVLRTAAQTN